MEPKDFGSAANLKILVVILAYLVKIQLHVVCKGLKFITFSKFVTEPY